MITGSGLLYALLAWVMPQALATAEGTGRVRLMGWAGAFFGFANLLTASLTLRIAMWLADRLAWLQGRR